MEYAALFLPLIGSILGYLIKNLGDLASQLVTTLCVLIASIFTIIIFYNGIFNGIYDKLFNL
jgi:hypothetical protein